jgi:tetratricopeptide (TPR) repeat protein
MKKIKSILFVLLLFLSFGSIKSWAIENHVLYANAEKAYKNQDYIKAIAYYHQIIESNAIASEVFYNLGNCYFKTDSVGKAIQYYEKARKLIGDEEDLMHNLKMAHNRTVDKIEPMPEFVVTSTWKNIVNFNTADTWANYSLLNFALVFMALIVFQLAKQPSIKKVLFGFSILLTIFSGLFYMLAKSRTNADESINHGVVIVSSASIKSAPQISSTDLFVIHEGTVFKILDKQTDWLKIRLDNGNLGWIPKNVIGEI